MSDDLAVRLTETLDEAERVAQEAQDDGLNPSWHGRRHQVFAHGGDTVCGHAALESVATHVARWDPQAVLRLVAAHRKLLEIHVQADPPYLWMCAQCGDEGQNIDCTYPCDTLRILAEGWGLSDG